MAEKKPQSKAIEIIYTFFVGVLVAVFVGVGIAAFYEEPKAPEYPATLKVYTAPVEGNTPSSASAKLVAEQQKYDAKMKIFEKQINLYNRNVSIIALIAAIILSSISITFFKNLRVIADGLLLGGVITLLYSVVRIFGSGDDKVRFVVVSIGLVVALALGYKKFITNSVNE
ncbi:MAG: hypothetical protein UZ21_OP11001000474 [Microgenomates bacterium OLB22]|nr:MAG: hypothetical protein UZ21_OP11001000474 [Microgenomates bacterium OLB22]